MEMRKMIPKLQPNQATNWDNRFKHIVITLRGQETIAWALSTPEAWIAVQGDRMKMLNRGDMVSVISPDGLSMADRVPVLRVEGGKVWFGKPARMLSFEEVALFETETERVVANGVGYSIQHKRSGRTDEKIFHTPEAAKVEIMKRQPVTVA